MALPDPWDKKSCTNLPPEQSLGYLPEPGLIPLPSEPCQGQPSWHEWISLFHMQPFPVMCFHTHCEAAGAPWVPAPHSTASQRTSGHWLWGTAPGCCPTYTGLSPRLFISRFTWAYREPTMEVLARGCRSYAAIFMFNASCAESSIFLI